jgi:hypothetical protein
MIPTITVFPSIKQVEIEQKSIFKSCFEIKKLVCVIKVHMNVMLLWFLIDSYMYMYVNHGRLHQICFIYLCIIRNVYNNTVKR